MASSLLSLSPNEIIDRISDELTGMDLFHFTLVYESSLAINDNYLIRLLSRQTVLSLDAEINSLITMPNSPYLIVDDNVTLMLSLCKWKKFVYGSFKLNVVERSLKYFSTPLFTLYCRLWSFTPFYYQSTYPIFDIFKYSYLLQTGELTNDECIFFKFMGNNQTPPKIVGTYTQFLENFMHRYEYNVWGSYVDWDLFIVAGGSVMSSMLVDCPNDPGSDVDLFFIKDDSHMFQIAVNELERRLQDKYLVRRKTIWSNRLIQFDLFRGFTMNNLFNGKSFTPSVIIQLIRPSITPTNISRILHSFDLDVCAIAFNSKQVIMTYACLQALNSGYATCYAISNSPSEFIKRIIRLFKYQQRGFNILCPIEFDMTAFMNTVIEDCKETQSARMYRFRKRRFGDNCDSFEIQKRFCEYYKLI